MSNQKRPQHERQLCLDLVNQNLPYSEITKQTGFGTAFIARIKKENGVFKDERGKYRWESKKEKDSRINNTSNYQFHHARQNDNFIDNAF